MLLKHSSSYHSDDGIDGKQNIILKERNKNNRRKGEKIDTYEQTNKQTNRIYEKKRVAHGWQSVYDVTYMLHYT